MEKNHNQEVANFDEPLRWHKSGRVSAPKDVTVASSQVYHEPAIEDHGTRDYEG